MDGFKGKVVQEIIRLGKKNHSLRMPALAVAALFLVIYHSVRNFFLEFRYHPVRQRILVGILVLSLLAGQIEIINAFAESDAGNTESRTISAFSELPGGVREQTVPAGTALEELTLPDTLEAVIVVQESEEPSEDTEIEEPSDGEETDTEDKDGDTEEISDGEENGQEETDTDIEETPGGEEDGQEETNTEETSDEEESEQEDTELAEAEIQAETQSFVMPEYQAENIIEVETINIENSQTNGAETVTLTGITWQSEPEYDGDTEGEYLFTPILPEGYVLAEGVSLPQITVTVTSGDNERITEPLITGWHFDEDDIFPKGELFYDEGIYRLVLAGGDEEVQIPFEDITSLLPEDVTVELICDAESGEAEPQETVLPITGWDCAEYVEDEEGKLPYIGEFLLTAQLGAEEEEEEYAFSDGVEPVSVTLVFDAPMMAAAVTASPGTITSNQEWGEQTLTAGTYTINPGVTVTVSGGLTINGNVTIKGGGKLVRGSSYKGSSSSGSAYQSCILYVSGGTLTLENVTVDGNDVEAYGPAVYIDSGTVNMKTDAVIQNNRNMNTGGTGVNAAGGIYCEGTLNIDGGTIRNCSTSKEVGSYAYAHAGGGVYLKSGNLNMTAGSITNNGASNGGGIYLASTGATLKLSGGKMSGNSATADGNGIYYSTKNAATSKVYISGDANVKDTIYLDNTSGELYPYITSTLHYPVTLSCSSTEEGKTLAGGSGGYELTGVDASKISMTGTSLYSRLNKSANQIYLSATEESEATWQESSGGAWKTGRFTTALANVYDGGTIKLLTDIVISEKAEITKAVTITSNNASDPCVMTRMPSGEYGNITISGNGNLTLTNVIYDGNRDYLQGAAEASKQSLIKIGNGTSDTGARLTLGTGAVIRNGYKTGGSGLFAVYGTMTMNNGAVIENCEATGTGGGVWVSSSGTFTMNGGTIHGCKAGGGGSAISIDGTCTLKGGSVTGNTDTSDKDCAVYLRSTGSGNLTLNGISISGNTYSVYNDGRSVSVTGDSTLSGSIYTTNAITASSNAVSSLTKTYAITLASPAVGDTVVNGSKDTQHYKLENTGYGLRTAADGSSKLVVAQGYKVSFNNNGGSGDTTAIDVLCGGTYGQLPTPTRTGYTFDGWYTAATGGSKVTATTIVTNTTAHTLYAHWTAKEYNITYSGLENATLTIKPTKHTYGTETKVGDPTKTGYTFAGWKINSGSTVSKSITLGATSYTADITLTATWTANTYTVTLNGNGGSAGTNLTSYTYGTGAALPVNWTKTGYTFDGWYENSSCTGIAVTSVPSTATGNKTYYAKWTAGQYKVTFDYQGATSGSGTAEKMVTYDNAYGALPIPQKTGYTFKGWYTQAGGQGGQVTAQTTVATANAHKLFACWKDETKPDAPVPQDGVNLPTGWTSAQASIPLKLYDGVGVTELWVKIDGGAYKKVDNFSSGSTAYSYAVGDGEHTYQFKAKDAAGNESADSAVFKVMLDKTPPVIDLTKMTVENGAKNLWNWIIGRQSMIIKIPVASITDVHSGIAEAAYTAVPDSGAQQIETISVKGGYYELALNAEFTGTIRLTAKDNAGNTTQVSLAAEGGKVIAEDYAPVVTITLPDTPTPNANGWYSTSFKITVTVTDDKNESGAVLSGGIAGITWKDGENGAVQTVSGLPGNAPVYEKEFTIQATDGTHTYYVNAVDNAGNESGWKTVTVSLDTGNPVFSGSLSVTNRTLEGVDITFTPSEGGKVYWIVDAGTKPDAQEVAEGGARNGNEEDITGGTQKTFTVGGFLPGTTHKVYVVLEDAVGNLSEVKEVSFTTLQAAPEITLEDFDIDHEKETVKLPESFGEVEVYTNPSDPEGSIITPNADGSLPIVPGTSIYIRYPEKTEAGMTTPASDSVKIDIPDGSAPPVAKQATVTDKAVTVTNPSIGEEYALVKKGQTPDWSSSNTTGQFEGLDPNTEYDLYVRKKATEDSFASEPVKTEVRTSVTIKEPVTTGDGAGEDSNTASKPDAPDAGGGTVTFTGTYGEEYTPVIIVDGQEYTPEMTWDEGSGKGKWEYTHDIPDGAAEVEITVEFRKRTMTGIAVTPNTLTIYADDAANESIDALTAYLKESSSVQAVYDNQTKGTVEADYTTADRFTVKSAAYNYTVSSGGETKGITLKVAPVAAAVTAPAELTQVQKDDGYGLEEVAAWLPTQVTVTYTGDGYTARTESRTVTWDTDSIGTDFGVELGRKTIDGTVNLPAWATGRDSVSIEIEFVDKTPLKEDQILLTIPDFSYGVQTLPGPKGSIAVEDTNPAYTYLYSMDNGVTWVTEDKLPKSDGGYIIPGEYRVKMTYTGDSYIGEKTAAFTVTKKPLEIQKGTLEAENRNYDGTTDASLKEGGQPVLSGVIAGDTVTLGGSLTAKFTDAGPKKDISVTVTGFLLEGRDAGYYELGNTTLTLYATINNADGTPPSGGNGGGNSGGNGSDDTGGGSDNNGGSTPGDNSDIGTPVVTPPAVTPPADTLQPAPGTEGSPDKITETQPAQQPEESPEQGEEPKNTDTDTPGQDSFDPAQTDNRPQPESEAVQTVQAKVADGRIIISGGIVETGNITETAETTTLLEVGEGTVIVTVVCEDEGYAAGVKDTVAVANAVLTPEQIQLVNDGETIEVRVDVKDISETVTGQDKEVIESGLTEYQKEIPELTLGMYVDISMFIRIGKGNWDAVTSTEEPIEVIIGIPEELMEDGREFYIIRSHEGKYTLLNDMDNDPDTVTIRTDMFSAYAIAFKQTDTDHAQGGNTKCGLCHICPTFLSVCYFIWLAIIIAVILVIVLIVWRRKKDEDKKQAAEI